MSQVHAVLMLYLSYCNQVSELQILLPDFS